MPLLAFHRAPPKPTLEGGLSPLLRILQEPLKGKAVTSGMSVAGGRAEDAGRPPDARRTYGYARLEALGAMINGAMLFVVAGYILWEAIGRFREPQEIASSGMLVTNLRSPSASRVSAASTVFCSMPVNALQNSDSVGLITGLT